MPVGYGARCKICNCEYRAEAERMHEEGKSLRAISNWLKSQGVDASVESVRKHMANHFGVLAEAAQRYAEKSAQVFEEAVQKRLSDLEMLDATIQSMFELHQGAKLWLEERVRGKGVYMDAKPMVDLLTGTAAELRQAIKLKAELLGETDDTVKVMFVDDLDDES
jgi:hypothetical protein